MNIREPWRTVDFIPFRMETASPRPPNAYVHTALGRSRPEWFNFGGIAIIPKLMEKLMGEEWFWPQMADLTFSNMII